MPVPRSRPWHRLVLPLTLFGVLGLAACGTAVDSATSTPSTSGSTADPAPSTEDGAGTADREAFRACLTKNGVPLPERGSDGTRPEGGTAPSGAPVAPPDGDGPPADGSAPAAGAPGGSGTRSAPPGVDADAWAAAQEACATLAPTPPS